MDGKFGKHVEQIPEGAEVIDYTGYKALPQDPVDTHIHGFGAVWDVMDTTSKEPFIP